MFEWDVRMGCSNGMFECKTFKWDVRMGCSNGMFEWDVRMGCSNVNRSNGMLENFVSSLD
jgi:hypothetical protein